MPDVPQDARKAAASPVLLPEDERRLATAAWDASDGARQAARAAGHPALPGVPAGKSVVPEPGARVQDDLGWLAAGAVVAVAEPGRRVAGRFAA